MSEMGWLDYVAMVEDTAVRTHLIEYRRPSADGGPGDLVGVCLTDLLHDGLSMVYSFYDPTMVRRSLGRFAILDHVRQAALVGLAAQAAVDRQLDAAGRPAAGPGAAAAGRGDGAGSGQRACL